MYLFINEGNKLNICSINGSIYNGKQFDLVYNYYSK